MFPAPELSALIESRSPSTSRSISLTTAQGGALRQSTSGGGPWDDPVALGTDPQIGSVPGASKLVLLPGSASERLAPVSECHGIALLANCEEVVATGLKQASYPGGRGSTVSRL